MIVLLLALHHNKIIYQFYLLTEFINYFYIHQNVQIWHYLIAEKCLSGNDIEELAKINT